MTPRASSVRVDGRQVEVRNRDGRLWGLDSSTGQWKPLYARLRGMTTVSTPEGDPRTMPAWQAAGGAASAGSSIGATIVERTDRYEFSFTPPADPTTRGWQWQDPDPWFQPTDEQPAPQSGWYREVQQPRLYDPEAGYYGGGITRQYGNPYEGWGYAVSAA